MRYSAKFEKWWLRKENPALRQFLQYGLRGKAKYKVLFEVQCSHCKFPVTIQAFESMNP